MLYRIFLALCVVICVAWHFSQPAADGTGPLAAVGGKAEHCALAIGMMAGAILSLFANPVFAPASLGVMSLGLAWMVGTC